MDLMASSLPNATRGMYYRLTYRISKEHKCYK